MKHTIYTMTNDVVVSTKQTDWQGVLDFFRNIMNGEHSVETDFRGNAKYVTVGDTQYWVTSDWSAMGSMSGVAGNDTPDVVRRLTV